MNQKIGGLVAPVAVSSCIVLFRLLTQGYTVEYMDPS